MQAKYNTTTIFVQDIFVLLMEYDSEIDYVWVCIRNHPSLLTGQDNLYQKYPSFCFVLTVSQHHGQKKHFIFPELKSV